MLASCSKRITISLLPCIVRCYNVANVVTNEQHNAQIGIEMSSYEDRRQGRRLNRFHVRACCCLISAALVRVSAMDVSACQS